MAVLLSLALLDGILPRARASEAICGKEEHVHGDECYELVLVCGQPSSEEHAHDDSCYERVLTCGKSEHTHAASCYPAPTEPPQVTETPRPTEPPQVTEAPKPTEPPQATDVPPPSGEESQATAEPQATDEPQITPQPEATDEARPTATPRPTDIQTPRPTPTPQLTPEPEATPLPGEDDDAVEQDDSDDDDASPLKIQMNVKPSVIQVGQKAVWHFKVQSETKPTLNWYLYKDGVQIKSGIFKKNENGFVFTPEETGVYAFKLVAKLPASDSGTGKELKVAKTVKLKVVPAPEGEESAENPDEGEETLEDDEGNSAEKDEENADESVDENVDENDNDSAKETECDLSLSLDAAEVTVGERAVYRYEVQSSEEAEITWQLFVNGLEIQAGRFVESAGSYELVPDELGVYAFKLTATIRRPAGEAQEEAIVLEKTKVVKLKVIVPPELTVSVKAHASSCFGGDSVSFGLTRSDNDYARSAEALVTVWQNGEAIYQSTEFSETVRVRPLIQDEAGTLRLTVRLRDRFDQVAEASVEIPCAMHETENRYMWSQMFSDVTLTGNWPQDLLTVAQTQLGYRESRKDFIIKDEGERQGWTRYGAWYGLPYEEWCCMFVSFCLDYAKVPEWAVPQSASQQRLRSRLVQKGLYASREDASPLPGDLIFFDHETEPWESGYGATDHIGIVLDADDDWVYTIEGNSNLLVRERQYRLTDKHITGYGLVNRAYEANLALTEAENEDEESLPETQRRPVKPVNRVMSALEN